jgi:hypothetical protein
MLHRRASHLSLGRAASCEFGDAWVRAARPAVYRELCAVSNFVAFIVAPASLVQPLGLPCAVRRTAFAPSAWPSAGFAEDGGFAADGGGMRESV